MKNSSFKKIYYIAAAAGISALGAAGISTAIDGIWIVNTAAGTFTITIISEIMRADYAAPVWIKTRISPNFVQRRRRIPWIGRSVEASRIRTNFLNETSPRRISRRN